MRRLLVIDDDENYRRALARGLGGKFAVVTVASGDEAVTHVRREPVDFVLCDILMPGLTGFEVRRRLVAERPELEKRFVFVSGALLDPATEAAVRDTGCPSVAKPFEMVTLENLIAQMMP